MVLLLKEQDVRALLPMSRAVELVERVFREEGAGLAVDQPRARLRYPDGLLNYMAGAVAPDHSVGLKVYPISRQGARFVVLLFDSETATLDAVIEADWLGRIRTGAASGVATKLLARRDARVAAVFGSGGQARTQIEGLLVARQLELIKIYSRAPEHRETLATELAGLGPEVRAVDSPQLAVQGSDIISTITSSAEPVFDGTWLEPGTHVNAAGSNRLTNREIDSITVGRAAVVATDSVDQARVESGDLAAAVKEGVLTWDDVTPLSAIASGRSPGRESGTQITLFESLGVAIEDIVVARWVVEEARRQGRGLPVDFGAGHD